MLTTIIESLHQTAAFHLVPRPTVIPNEIRRPQNVRDLTELVEEHNERQRTCHPRRSIRLSLPENVDASTQSFQCIVDAVMHQLKAH